MNSHLSYHQCFYLEIRNLKTIIIIGKTKEKNVEVFFDEVDVLQRLQAGPIPEEIWIPNSSQDEVQAYFKNIALPKTASDEHQGKL